MKNKNIITSNWKEFKIGDLFTLEKGKCSNAPDLDEGDEIFYIGAKKTENGVMKSSKIDKKLISKGNCICFICQGAGSNGFNNYFDSNTIQSTSNTLGYNKNLTKNIGLFLVTILDLERFKWSFGRGRSPKLKNETIKLPVDENGNPDWNFMENFIETLSNRDVDLKELSKPFKHTTKIFLNKNEWKEFKIGDLFEITRGKRIVKNRDYVETNDEKNIFPVITSKTTNNAVDGYYHKFNCEGNVITCGGEASGMVSQYQEYKCWVMDRSRILKPKFNNFNKYIAMFLIVLFNKHSYRFSYGNSANPSDIEKLIIKLPTNINGDPDWQFMEEYIKSLEFSKYI